MVDLTYEVDLFDSKSIQRTIAELEGYEVKLARVIQMSLPEIAERIERRLLLELSQFGLGGSSLASSISVIVVDDGIEVTVGSDHAMFLEFGTGIKGQQSPHPNPNWLSSWNYDINNHGEEGWWYPTDDSDPNPIKRRGGGKVYGWTRGHEARPFMYNTWRYTRRMAPQIFNKYMKKVFT